VPRCAESTEREGARKTAAGAGFFPNYPILGIGRVEVIAYASTALNFPVQSVFLKPPGTAIRWLFLLAPAKCRRFARCVPAPQPVITMGNPGRRQRWFEHRDRARYCHPSCGLWRRFAAGSPTDYPQVACDRNCKQNACALRQPSSGTMPQLHRAPRIRSLSRASCNRRVHSLSI